MKKIILLDELQNFIATRTNIYTLKKGVCYCYRVIGIDPFIMTGGVDKFILIEKNTHETKSVSQLTLDVTDFYVGEYDAQFIGQILFDYHQEKTQYIQKSYKLENNGR